MPTQPKLVKLIAQLNWFASGIQTSKKDIAGQSSSYTNLYVIETALTFSWYDHDDGRTDDDKWKAMLVCLPNPNRGLSLFWRPPQGAVGPTCKSSTQKLLQLVILFHHNIFFISPKLD